MLKAGLVMLLMYVLIFIGWVMNIYKLVTHLDVIGNVEIVRIVGVVVFPLGSVMGWFV